MPYKRVDEVNGDMKIETFKTDEEEIESMSRLLEDRRIESYKRTLPEYRQSDSKGRITKAVKQVNTLKGVNLKNRRTRKKEKIDIKNKPKIFSKPKIYILAGIVVGGLILTSWVQLIKFSNNEKQELLNDIKTEISASTGISPESIKVYDKSSPTGSNSYVDYYVVNAGGKEYSYIQKCNGGSMESPIKDELKNPDLNEAISTVASDGIVSGLRARRIRKALEAREIDLKIHGKSLDKENSR